MHVLDGHPDRVAVVTTGRVDDDQLRYLLGREVGGQRVERLASCAGAGTGAREFGGQHRVGHVAGVHEGPKYPRC